MPVNDDLLARADGRMPAQPIQLSADEQLIRDLAAALRAALAARPQAEPDEPTALDMVTELHRAIYGDTWARPESPQQVWDMLLTRVSGLAQGWCGECERRAAREAVAGSAAPTGDDE